MHFYCLALGSKFRPCANIPSMAPKLKSASVLGKVVHRPGGLCRAEAKIARGKLAFGPERCSADWQAAEEDLRVMQAGAVEREDMILIGKELRKVAELVKKEQFEDVSVNAEARSSAGAGPRTPASERGDASFDSRDQTSAPLGSTSTTCVAGGGAPASPPAQKRRRLSTPQSKQPRARGSSVACATPKARCELVEARASPAATTAATPCTSASARRMRGKQSPVPSGSARGAPGEAPLGMSPAVSAAGMPGTPASMRRMRGKQSRGASDVGSDRWGACPSSAAGQDARGACPSSGTVAGLPSAQELCLRGLNVNYPFSQLILHGVKTVEVREYDLGHRNIAHADEELFLIETPAKAKDAAQLDGFDVCPPPPEAQVVGTVKFSHSSRYRSLPEFRRDRPSHRIQAGSKRYCRRGANPPPLGHNRGPIYYLGSPWTF